MPITQLNHCFVRANDLEKTKDFYVKVLGLDVLPRPDFPFPGYWLGFNGQACIHMGPHDAPDSDLYYLSDPNIAATTNGGVVDHIAFLASDPRSFRIKFEEMGIEHRERSLPDSDLYQMFVKDPNGLVIELNFFGLQNVKGWGGEDFSKTARSVTRK